ncbi:MAG TPA: hypothetical protein VLL52_17530 [Anaerolineae bacterium]|nr:hypothetical protein [Anaerolineae bacterium]
MSVLMSLVPGVLLPVQGWQWATWRGVGPSPRPPTTPVDWPDIRRRYEQACQGRSPAWRWSRASLQVGMGREEAHFWLTVMNRHHHWRMEGAWMAGFTGELTAEERERLLPSASRRVSAEWMIPLACLYDSETLMRVSLTKGWWGVALAVGWRRYVWPYLGETERAVVTALVRAEMMGTSWPEPQERLPAVFLLAGMVGLGEMLAEVVARWPADMFGRYPQRRREWGQRPQEILLGLGSGERVVAERERLKLPLRSAEQVQGWLAHTGLDGFEVVRWSVATAEARLGMEMLATWQAAVTAEEALAAEMGVLSEKAGGGGERAAAWRAARGLERFVVGKKGGEADLLAGWLGKAYLVEMNEAEVAGQLHKQIRRWGAGGERWGVRAGLDYLGKMETALAGLALYQLAYCWGEGVYRGWAREVLRASGWWRGEVMGSFGGWVLAAEAELRRLGAKEGTKLWEVVRRQGRMVAEVIGDWGLAWDWRWPVAVVNELVAESALWREWMAGTVWVGYDAEGELVDYLLMMAGDGGRVWHGADGPHFKKIVEFGWWQAWLGDELPWSALLWEAGVVPLVAQGDRLVYRGDLEVMKGWRVWPARVLAEGYRRDWEQVYVYGALSYRRYWPRAGVTAVVRLRELVGEGVWEVGDCVLAAGALSLGAEGERMVGGEARVVSEVWRDWAGWRVSVFSEEWM